MNAIARFFAVLGLVALSFSTRLAGQAHYLPYSFMTVRGSDYYAPTAGSLAAGAAAGTVYVDAGAVYQIASSDLTKSIPLGPNPPVVCTVDRLGNFYTYGWPDATHAQIVKTTPDGTSTPLATFDHDIVAYGLAVSADSTVYFSTGYGGDVRKIAPDGTVSVLAGQRGVFGSTDGAGSVATFRAARGLAVDATGNVFVADTVGIRKITPDGIVSTFAGSASGQAGYVDGPRLSARFNGPGSVALDPTGNLFVADASNHSVRIITPDGMVSTVGGIASVTGNADGVGPTALFSAPEFVAVDAAGTLYVLDPIAKTLKRAIAQLSTPVPTVAALPVIATPPHDQTVRSGDAVSLYVAALNATSYQWLKAGVPLTGQTRFTLALSAAQSTDTGAYSVLVSNAAGAITSSSATLTVVDDTPGTSSQLSNLSTLTQVGQMITMGFALGGGGLDKVLIRAAGPSLTPFGIANALPDPTLTLLRGQTVVAQDDNWDSSLSTDFASVGAFAWPTGSKDAAVTATLPTGAYSVQIMDKNGGDGVCLAELYDDSISAGAGLRNVSTLSFVGAAGQTAGFVITGNTPKKIVIRGAGPILASLGVANVLADPVLTLYAGETILAQNDDWDAALAPDFAKVGAFSWYPGSKDAALVVTLSPGTYTAQVRGKNGATGMALVEIYQEE